MQPQKKKSTFVKIMLSIVIGISAVITLVVIIPLVMILFAFLTQGAQGKKDASYMKTEFAKISIPGDFKQQSVECHDVELGQVCYFTYRTSQTVATATDTIKQTFSKAGYDSEIGNSQYSIGGFRNSKKSLYVNVIYQSSKEIAPAYRTTSQDSQVTIQMSKLSS